jgi:hypothetical protein
MGIRLWLNRKVRIASLNYRKIKILFQREVALKKHSPVDSGVIFDKTSLAGWLERD